MNLSPTEALNHLDKAASTFKGTRDDHALLQFATVLLRKIIEDNDKLSKDNARLVSELNRHANEMESLVNVNHVS